jgi:serine/threonine protein kinase
LSVIRKYKDIELVDWTDGKKETGLCTTTHQPPELWLNREFNNKLDIWSYGCLLFEMKNRDFLFAGESTKEVYSFFFHRPELLKKRKLENAVFDELILRCLKFEPNDRPKASELTEEKIIPKTYTIKDTTRTQLDKYFSKKNLVLADCYKEIFYKIYEQLPKKDINLSQLLAFKFLDEKIKGNPGRSVLVAERNLVKNGFKITL